MAVTFRFETLEVWKRAAALSLELFEFADELEAARKYKFAEQFRAAVLSMTNNMAEGSGCVSRREFARFMDISRRSVFEVANMLLLFCKARLVAEARIRGWLIELDAICRMSEGLRRTLLSERA